MNRKEFLTYPKLIRFKREDCENEIKKIDISLEKLNDKELDNYNTTCSLLIGCYSKGGKHKFSLDITSLNLSVKDLINIIKTTRKRIVKERDFLLMKERNFLIK